MAPIRISRERVRWPDRSRGPFVADTFWAEIDGRLQCVGMMLASFEDLTRAGAQPVGDDLEPVTTTLLRSAPWGELMDRRRRGHSDVSLIFGMTPSERGRVAAKLRRQGLPLEDATPADWISAMPPTLRDRVLGRFPTRDSKPKGAGGRPRQYTDEDWQARAAVYLNAQRAGRHPNVALKEAFNVSISTARSWSARLRRMGLLATEGHDDSSEED